MSFIPSDRVATNASVVRHPAPEMRHDVLTPFSSSVFRRKFPNGSSPTLPMNPESIPTLDNPTATFAGAPPGALVNPAHSARDLSVVVETKSMTNSPIHRALDIFHRLLKGSACCVPRQVGLPFTHFEVTPKLASNATVRLFNLTRF